MKTMPMPKKTFRCQRQPTPSAQTFFFPRSFKKQRSWDVSHSTQAHLNKGRMFTDTAWPNHNDGII